MWTGGRRESGQRGGTEQEQRREEKGGNGGRARRQEGKREVTHFLVLGKNFRAREKNRGTRKSA
jgi:hypothetical protein